MRISRSVTAALLAIALPLAACTTEEELAEPKPVESSSTQTEAENTTEAEAEEKTEPEEAASETYEDVDPVIFDEGGAYVVGGSSGVLGCMAKPGTDYPFNCQITFADPVPPAEDPDGSKFGYPPNIASYDEPTGRFRPEFSPGSQGYMTPPTPLERGQRVTIDGATMTHLHDGGFRVEYKGDSFEVHDGVYSGTPAQEEKPVAKTASGTVNKGEQCGTYTRFGEEMGVYALEDGTTCDQAMSTLKAYFVAEENGEMQGTVTAWTDPQNGWGCFGRYLLPGDTDEPANRKVSCGDTQMNGTKAFDGSGSVVLLDPADAARI
ncbi:hypothetical protein A0K93_03755 [Corynebacterium sp. BCW_4722]|nr:hypothetical protein A0K93_03755 [Corynebacterium sp. BCW_4722]